MPCIAAQSDVVNDDLIVERAAKERRLDEAREFERLKVNSFETIFLMTRKSYFGFILSDSVRDGR